MREPLTTAIRIANDAHEGQVDKVGMPYILHPLRVMLRLTGEDERIVAVLHDVIEDTAVTESDLQEHGFTKEIVDAVRALTRDESETYDEFILRAGANSIARKVKLADLEDNLDETRLPHPLTENDVARIAKYKKAKAALS